MERNVPTNPIPPASRTPIDELLDHRAWVRALARSLVRDPSTADDVEQQTWLAALRSPPSERATARAWLAKVVRNAVRQQGRAEGRRSAREAAVARDDTTTATIDVVARVESHKRLVLAVMDLDEPYRTTVLLRYFEGLPPRDVAGRMDVPVETVRTRTRRALERLRHALDTESGGDGRGWRSALAPLLTAPDSVPSARPRAGAHPPGGAKMSPMKIAAIAVLVAALPASWLLLGRGNADAPAPNVATAEDHEIVADAQGADGRGRVRVPPPPVAPLAPGDEDDVAGPEDDAEAVPLFGPAENPLPPHEDAAVFADGRLSLHVSVDPPQPRAGERFDLVVTFRNDGTGSLRFHVPEHAGLVPFPRLEMLGSDGLIRIPISGPFQSMWQRGLQGEIVRLEPGEEHVLRSPASNIAEFAADSTEDERARAELTQKRIALPPGDYVVTAVLDKAKSTVPVGGPGFKVEHREVPGLWTGAIRSSPVTIRVAPPDEPMFTLRGPKRFVPGEAMVLELTVANPSSEPREVQGAFALRRSQKGGPSYAAWFAFGDDAAPARPDHTRVLRLDAGESRVCRLDVGALLWTRASLRRTPFRHRVWPFDRTSPAIWVTCGERAEDGTGMLGSNTIFATLAAAPDLWDSGLVLEVEAHGLTATPPFVGVRVVNRGLAAVAVPTRLRSPRSVSLALHAREGKERPHELAVTDEEAFALLRPDEVRVLAPGESVFARVALAADWAATVSPGSYDLRGRWSSVDSCAREGFVDRPVVGRLNSQPVPVEIGPR